MIEQFIAPFVQAGVNILKERMKAKSALSSSKRDAALYNRVMRLEFNSLMHLIILGELMETLRNDTQKSSKAVTSVVELGEAYKILLREGVKNDPEVKKSKMNDETIDKALQEGMDIIQAEIDMVTKFIKVSASSLARE